jgi:hypothetical protein
LLLQFPISPATSIIDLHNGDFESFKAADPPY